MLKILFFYNNSFIFAKSRTKTQNIAQKNARKGKYVEIPDRKEAIAYAIHHGEPGDIVVLAGKGHEDYQEIKGKKYPMDERVLIADILAGK